METKQQIESMVRQVLSPLIAFIVSVSGSKMLNQLLSLRFEVNSMKHKISPKPFLTSNIKQTMHYKKLIWKKVLTLHMPGIFYMQ